jgi:sugar lactone lactonase YvrE
VKQSRAHVRVAWAASTELGECPRWNPVARSVDFVDLARGELLRYTPATGANARRRVATELGFLAIDAAGAAFAGSGLDVLGLGADRLTRAADDAVAPAVHWTVPGAATALRLNDARFDARGALWTGTMDRRGREPLGALYRCTPGDPPECVDAGYTIPNGFAFDRAGRRLYVADSPVGCVHVYEVDARGVAGSRRTWLRVPSGDGYPDGMAVDDEDHVWIAFYDGGCVRRYDPDGALACEVRLPAPRITACAFGGEPAVLYATSARDSGRRPGLLQRLRGDPAGALFEIRLA